MGLSNPKHQRGGFRASPWCFNRKPAVEFTEPRLRYTANSSQIASESLPRMMTTVDRFRLPALAALLVSFATANAAAQLPPEQELAALRPAEGIEVSLFAAEPLLTNPSAIDIDTQGRVWVAEIEFYRKFADKPPADKIKVLEDTDGDGRADRATVFAEGVFSPMSICVAGPLVFVATSPDLWMYEDRNGDLKADGPPKKLLTGFGGLNHDHGAHSLVLGPDHKWWMSHGDTGFDVTGTDGSHIKFEWGGVLRGELDGSQLETVAVNFRNPYEVCVDSFGEAYLSDNDNDGNFSTRICWILEGGDYGWFGRPPERVAADIPFSEGWHFRAYQPGYVPGTIVTGFGSPCGICFYEGDAFGAKWKNAPLHADAGPREVRRYPHEPLGYGMKGASQLLLTSQGDDYFRPDDVCAAPDGSLYVADWYDGGVGGHAYNDPHRGRIFRLTPKGKKLARREKPGPYASSADAIVALASPNLATQFLARERLLAEPDVSVSLLTKLAESGDDPNLRARALWVLERIGGSARDVVLATLADDDPRFRALAVRILRRHGADYADKLLPLAEDTSPLVKREVLLTIARLDTPAAFEALSTLAVEYKGQDRYLLEAINIAAGSRKRALYESLVSRRDASVDQLPLLALLDSEATAELQIRQLADAKLSRGDRQRVLQALATNPSLDSGRSVLRFLQDESADIELRRLALGVVRANLGGAWRELSTDERLHASVTALLANRDWQEPALALIGDRSLATLSPQVVALATSTDAPTDSRRRAIEIAAALRPEGIAAALAPLLDDRDPAVRRAAAVALVDLQDWPTIEKLLANGSASESETDAETRRAAVERLTASTGGALWLLRAIDANKLDDRLRSTTIARAVTHPDANVRTLFERFLPEGERPQRLGEAIRADEILKLDANASRGREIFFQSTAARCKDCHTVRGEGGSLGPDLSQIGRKYERATLLETILDPSKAIAPEYVPHLVETSSGQLYAGFVVERSDEQVVLKDAEGRLIRVAGNEVEAIEPQTKSVMPDLVLRDVTAQDAADLLAYLATLREAVQEVSRFRMLGPFPRGQGAALDRDFGPEKQLAVPDLSATYKGINKEPATWEVVAAEAQAGHLLFDQVKHAESTGMRATKVVNYYLVFVDSATEQEAKLLIGSDDGCRVWVGSHEVHRFDGTRALTPAQDEVTAKLAKGRNAIVIKVENGDGPGGVSLAIAAPQPVELRTE